VRGRLTPGDFSLIFAYMRSLFGPLVWLGSTWGEVVGAVNNLEAVVDVYNTRAVVVDGPEARTLVADPVLIAQRRFGEVAFENVSFHYAQDGAPNGVSVGGIYNVSFRVPPGRVVGICGASGSGKSTIGRVLLRFYQPDAGRVLLDGLDTSRYTLASLRQCIGVIPQETVLFDDTLRYNITYGRPRATDVEVWDAVIAAEMVDFVKQQPLGLDTVTGARGVKTSGGERQRIGAARCICKQPAVVLLDESTSALDAQTEKLVQASFERLFRGRTTVVIAHRLSTIQRADEILVLAPCDDPSASSIVERGTHEQLVAQGGRYAAMWAAQTGEDHAKR
jgi:ATP-binding cassette, subfamily B, heavy metal transporter